MIIKDLEYLEKSESTTEITGGTNFNSNGQNNTISYQFIFNNIAAISFTFTTNSGYLLGQILSPLALPFKYTFNELNGNDD